ncbi:MAG: haloacid dehalogenase-like hydrolase [Planctomycetes bacterium]|nr:haloacid dehalogenase-like hydrolase [Planctomycetota bacterium]
MTEVPLHLRAVSLFFDFDSTIVGAEAVDELAGIALRGAADREARVESIRAITNAGMEGSMAIDESLRRRLDMIEIRAAMLPELVELLKSKLSPSMLRNAPLLKAMRDRIWVISSGFHEWIDPVVASLGLRSDHVLANRLKPDARGILRLDPASRCAAAGSKALAAAALGRTPPRVMVGDGMTDFEVRQEGACEYFAAWTECVTRPKVVAVADMVAPHFEGLLDALEECLA